MALTATDFEQLEAMMRRVFDEKFDEKFDEAFDRKFPAAFDEAFERRAAPEFLAIAKSIHDGFEIQGKEIRKLREDVLDIKRLVDLHSVEIMELKARPA